MLWSAPTARPPADPAVARSNAALNIPAGTARLSFVTNHDLAVEDDLDGVVTTDDQAMLSRLYARQTTTAARPSWWLSDPGRGATTGTDNAIGYAGYRFNLESGQYEVRFRTYSPTLGRWLQRDPAGYVDGDNSFRYASSTPTTRADPSGLKSLPFLYTYGAKMDESCYKDPFFWHMIQTYGPEIKRMIERAWETCYFRKHKDGGKDIVIECDAHSDVGVGSTQNEFGLRRNKVVVTLGIKTHRFRPGQYSYGNKLAFMTALAHEIAHVRQRCRQEGWNPDQEADTCAEIEAYAAEDLAGTSFSQGKGYGPSALCQQACVSVCDNSGKPNDPACKAKCENDCLAKGESWIQDCACGRASP